VIVSTGAWYGWTFILAIVILLINAVFLFNKPFPSQQVKEVPSEEEMSII